MFFLKSSAFKNYINCYRKNLINEIDPLIALNNSKTEIKNILKNKNFRLRFIISLKITFEKLRSEDIVNNSFYFTSNAERLLSEYEINVKLESAFTKILKRIEDFINLGSGWNIKNIDFIELNIGRYKDLNGGCQYASLPQSIKNKKCTLTVKSFKNMCFIFSILAAIFPNKNNKTLCSTYQKYLKYLKYSFLTFPVQICEIPKFEQVNKLQINVYGFENEIFPIYKSKHTAYKEVNLLLFKNHFFLITNFNRLLHEKKGIHKFCKNCLIGFARQSTLNSHVKRCIHNEPRRIKLPTDNEKYLKFNAFHKMFFQPFCVYADFESITEKVSSVEPNPINSYSIKKQIHKPIAYSLVLIDDKKQIVFHKFYCGIDAVQNFILCLQNISHSVLLFMEKNEPFDKNEKDIINPEKCHLCGKYFSNGIISVVNHDHITGKILGKACQGCNLNYKFNKYLNVILHGFRNYDSHLILKKLSRELGENLTIIPVNSQKCTSFILDRIRFLDSFLFLPSKLSDLVENLKISKYNFPIFNSFFNSYKHRKHLLRKGVFPYSYFDSTSVLEEKNLPQRHCFFDDLNNKDISEDDYRWAKFIFQKFKCVTFKDYLRLYLDCDVMLLADVFENFRNLSMNYFELDPVNFYTSPSLTFTAGLKVTGVTIELLTDIDMYLLIESGIRGGMCFTSKRYAKANNVYLANFNKNLPSNYIVSLDVNNLYGTIQACFKMPVSNFKWLSQEEIQSFDIMSYDKHSNYGFILCVDLHCPPNIHDLHKCFPLAPNHESIEYDMLSNYQRNILTNLGLKFNKNKKLLNTFNDKTNYVVHYLNLKFYVKHGLQIKKIHKIISFKQSYWLRPYTLFNNDKRKEATNSFDKDFFKLMNNAFFGKTCMNVRKHVNVKVGLSEKECQKFLSDPGLEFFSVINDNCALFKILKSTLFLNQPLFIGMTVLDLAKLYMFELYYEVFLPVYGNKNMSLIYTDTDSMVMDIKTENIYDDLSNKFKHVMDFSNYTSSRIELKQNQACLGYLKDETRGIPIQEFIALRPKQYSYKFGSEEKRTAKGTKKSVIKTFLNHNLYLDILKTNASIKNKQTSIISKNHEISTIIQNKTSLSCFYDKMYLCDSINCLPYGHYSIGKKYI